MVNKEKKLKIIQKTHEFAAKYVKNKINSHKYLGSDLPGFERDFEKELLEKMDDYKNELMASSTNKAKVNVAAASIILNIVLIITIAALLL